MKEEVIYLTKDDENKYRLVGETRCSRAYCSEYGCCFPDCAELGEEVFDSPESARSHYKDKEVVCV